MKYGAQITNGTVTNKIILDDDAAAAEFNAILCDGDVGIGWTFDGTGFSPPTPPAPIPIPVPELISDRQFAQGLAVQGYITTAEALAWVGPGTLPAVFETLLAGLQPAEAFQARMLLTGATEFRRHHPLVDVIGTTNGWSPEAIDDFWRFCATL